VASGQRRGTKNALFALRSPLRPQPSKKTLTRRVASSTLPSNIQGTTVTPVADLDLLQGTLDVLVLKTLSWGPRHGYAVAGWIRETTNDDLQVEEGALYTALHRMEKRGWIESEWGLSENNRKAKYYELTPAGRQQLRAQTTRWTRYAQAVFRVLQTQTA
jgi:PadR family transcriptional regulator, regulatory protein PadR